MLYKRESVFVTLYALNLYNLSCKKDFCESFLDFCASEETVVKPLGDITSFSAQLGTLLSPRTVLSHAFVSHWLRHKDRQ